MNPKLAFNPKKLVVGAKDLVMEAHFLSAFDHENIIKLRGWSAASFFYVEAFLFLVVAPDARLRTVVLPGSVSCSLWGFSVGLDARHVGHPWATVCLCLDV